MCKNLVCNIILALLLTILEDLGSGAWYSVTAQQYERSSALHTRPSNSLDLGLCRVRAMNAQIILSSPATVCICDFLIIHLLLCALMIGYPSRSFRVTCDLHFRSWRLSRFQRAKDSRRLLPNRLAPVHAPSANNTYRGALVALLPASCMR